MQGSHSQRHCFLWTGNVCRRSVFKGYRVQFLQGYIFLRVIAYLPVHFENACFLIIPDFWGFLLRIFKPTLVMINTAPIQTCLRLTVLVFSRFAGLWGSTEDWSQQQTSVWGCRQNEKNNPVKFWKLINVFKRLNFTWKHSIIEVFDGWGCVAICHGSFKNYDSIMRRNICCHIICLLQNYHNVVFFWEEMQSTTFI